MSTTFKVSEMALPCKSNTMICRQCGKSNPSHNDGRCAICGGICDPSEMVRRASLRTTFKESFGLAGVVAVVQEMNKIKELKTATAKKSMLLMLGGTATDVHVV